LDLIECFNLQSELLSQRGRQTTPILIWEARKLCVSHSSSPFRPKDLPAVYRLILRPLYLGTEKTSLLSHQVAADLDTIRSGITKTPFHHFLSLNARLQQQIEHLALLFPHLPVLFITAASLSACPFSSRFPSQGLFQQAQDQSPSCPPGSGEIDSQHGVDY
jgi:hypothetical protein